MWDSAMIAAGEGSLLLYAAIVVVIFIGAYLRMKMEQAANEQRKLGPKLPPSRPEVPRSEIEVEEPGRRPPPRPAVPQRPPRPQQQAPRPPVVWQAPGPRRPQQPRPVARPQPAAQRPSPQPARPPQDRRVSEGPPEEDAQRVGPRLAPTVRQEQQRIASNISPVTGAVATEPKAGAEPEVGSLAAQQAQVVESKRPLVQVVGLAPSDLQRVFIFSEVFGPPLALREQQTLF